jgi:tetratricopeptide (TPR) repeat protein
VSALDPAIRRTETQLALKKQPNSLRAWDHVLRGVWHLNGYTKQGNLNARQEFEQAIELDNGYATAIAWLSMTYSNAAMLNWTDARTEALRTAAELAKRATALDDEDPLCHVVVAMECFWNGRLAPGRHASERALELNPNSFHAHYILGAVRNYQGESAASVRASETALNLSPNEPIAWHCMGSLAHAHYNLREYEKVIAVADQAIARRAGYLFGRILKTAALGQLGRILDAEQSLREITTRRPLFGADTFDYYPFEIEEQRQHLIEGLHIAGLPD